MSVKSMTELKKLNTLQSKLQGEMEVLKNQKELLAKEITTKNEQINNVKHEIAKLKKRSQELIVSEHAILRYMERVLKLDIAAFANSILTDEVRKEHKLIGNGTYSVNNSEYQLVIRNNVVVSVTAD